MNDAQQTASTVIASQVLAALGTLHSGEPSVSMVPFAILAEGPDVVIHVSGLSTHTADMLGHPRVSVLVIAADEELPPQATPRITIAGDARKVDRGSAEELAAREAYLARFPDAEPMFELGDFSLFLIRPRSVRVIGGFGRAATLTAEQFGDAVRR